MSEENGKKNAIPVQRLPTLGRDLVNYNPLQQPARQKTFVPNLKASKKKVPGTSTSARATPPQPAVKPAVQPSKPKESVKVRREARPQFVQTASMFADGIAAPQTDRHGLSTGGGEKSSSMSSSGLKTEMKQEFSRLSLDSFVSDIKEGNRAPLANDFLKSESKVEEPDIADFLFGANRNGRLFSVKLPNILPSPAAHEGAKAKEGEEKPRMDLSTFPEGRIGKIQRLRNGEVRMKIGEVYFDVDYLCRHPHLTELGKWSPPQQEDGLGEFKILGHVTDKLVVTPRIPDLIAELERKREDKAEDS